MPCLINSQKTMLLVTLVYYQVLPSTTIINLEIHRDANLSGMVNNIW